MAILNNGGHEFDRRLLHKKRRRKPGRERKRREKRGGEANRGRMGQLFEDASLISANLSKITDILSILKTEYTIKLSLPRQFSP